MATVHILEYDPEACEATVQVTTDAELNGQLQTVSIDAFGCDTLESLMRTPFRLTTFLASDIVLEDALKVPKRIAGSIYGYRIWAELVDAANRHARLGDIHISLDGDIPKDIPNGALISFTALRMDFDTD